MNVYRSGKEKNEYCYSSFFTETPCPMYSNLQVVPVLGYAVIKGFFPPGIRLIRLTDIIIYKVRILHKDNLHMFF